MVRLSYLKLSNESLLASGKDIHEINAERKTFSQIKGGGLWQYLGKRSVCCLLISDVQGDDPRVIGSGLLFPELKEKAQKAQNELLT